MSIFGGGRGERFVVRGGGGGRLWGFRLLGCVHGGWYMEGHGWNNATERLQQKAWDRNATAAEAALRLARAMSVGRLMSLASGGVCCAREYGTALYMR